MGENKNIKVFALYRPYSVFVIDDNENNNGIITVVE